MKNETARREIESLDYYLQNHTDDYSEESHTAMMMGIKALEQEPVLDKIRAEIEQAKDTDFQRNRKTYDKCLEIIDKYRAESERVDADSN